MSPGKLSSFSNSFPNPLFLFLPSNLFSPKELKKRRKKPSSPIALHRPICLSKPNRCSVNPSPLDRSLSSFPLLVPFRRHHPHPHRTRSPRSHIRAPPAPDPAFHLRRRSGPGQTSFASHLSFSSSPATRAMRSRPRHGRPPPLQSRP